MCVGHGGFVKPFVMTYQVGINDFGRIDHRPVDACADAFLQVGDRTTVSVRPSRRSQPQPSRPAQTPSPRARVSSAPAPTTASQSPRATSSAESATRPTHPSGRTATMPDQCIIEAVHQHPAAGGRRGDVAAGQHMHAGRRDELVCTRRPTVDGHVRVREAATNRRRYLVASP